METVEYMKANGLMADLQAAVANSDFDGIAFMINVSRATTGYVKMAEIWAVIDACK